MEIKNDDAEYVEISDRYRAILGGDRPVPVGGKGGPALSLQIFILGILQEIDKLCESKPSPFREFERKQAILLEAACEVVYEILKEEEFAETANSRLSDLGFALIEIGRHLPLLSSLTGGDFGLMHIVEHMPGSVITKSAHSRISSEGRKAGHETDRKKRLEMEAKYPESDPDREKYEKCVAYAREQWGKGDKRLPHVMARWIKQDTVTFREANPRRLTELLKPVAEDEFGLFHPRSKRAKKLR